MKGLTETDIRIKLLMYIIFFNNIFKNLTI